MTRKSTDASSSGSSKRNAERSVQPGSIDRNPTHGQPGTGIDRPGDALGLRTCYLCYDDDGARICNEIPCPASSDDMVVSSAVAPPPADAAAIDAASGRKPNDFAANAERSAQPGGISRDPVIEQPRSGSGFELPRDVSGLAEACYMCHEHSNGATVCHEITCP